jgi:hypothetical protein
MHRHSAHLLAISLLVAIPATASGQELEAARSKPPGSDDLAYDLLRRLTTAFGARPAGSVAELAAARWGSETMKALGFRAVAIERFPLLRWNPGETRVELVADVTQRLVATPLGGLEAGPAVEAPVAVFNSYQAFVQSGPAQVRGRIVAILEPVRREANGDGYISLAPARTRGPGEALARVRTH